MEEGVEGIQVSSFKFQVSGFRFQVSGFRFQVMVKAERFEDLVIFQKARELCKNVYCETSKEPWKFDSRFVQQIHASAGSVMDNIAEGYERDGNKELKNFLYISKKINKWWVINIEGLPEDAECVFDVLLKQMYNILFGENYEI